MEKKNHDLLYFLIGIIMLGVGIYLFSSKVVVSTGFGFMFGSSRINGGLVVVPLIVGIVWWFINPKSIVAKIITALGGVMIVASVIMNTRFFFYDNLYNYIIMLVLMCGGAGLILRVLFRKRDK